MIYPTIYKGGCHNTIKEVLKKHPDKVLTFLVLYSFVNNAEYSFIPVELEGGSVLTALGNVYCLNGVSEKLNNPRGILDFSSIAEIKIETNVNTLKHFNRYAGLHTITELIKNIELL